MAYKRRGSGRRDSDDYSNDRNDRKGRISKNRGRDNDRSSRGDKGRPNRRRDSRDSDNDYSSGRNRRGSNKRSDNRKFDKKDERQSRPKREKPLTEEQKQKKLDAQLSGYNNKNRELTSGAPAEQA